MTRAECETLRRVRELHEKMERLKDGLRELRLLSTSISSPKMDGMPKQQGGAKDIAAQTLARIEKQEEEIARMAYSIERAKKGGQLACRMLDTSRRTFYNLYCNEGEPFCIAQAASGVQERQCRRYLQDIAEK